MARPTVEGRNAPVGVVVIGRNEGERLRACLESLRTVRPLVYVDSGSTDGSQALAATVADCVVELDRSTPFSAGRARNEGIAAVLSVDPQIAFVQTVDGDCTVDADWLDRARCDLEANPTTAVVFGRRREKFAVRNAYHRAADDEWAVPLGKVGSCGGDAMFRVAAFREVGGFNPALIAGEEPDLCLRLRASGWTILSNGAEMTAHDIDMSRMAQWWQRSRRAGFAFAQLTPLHGRAADPSWPRLVHSAMLWSLLILSSLAALLIGAVLQIAPLVLLGAMLTALVLANVVRLAAKRRHRLGGWAPALSWGGLLMIAKLAEATGAVEFALKRRSGQNTAIMEYKS